MTGASSIKSPLLLSAGKLYTKHIQREYQEAAAAAAAFAASILGEACSDKSVLLGITDHAQHLTLPTVKNFTKNESLGVAGRPVLEHATPTIIIAVVWWTYVGGQRRQHSSMCYRQAQNAAVQVRGLRRAGR